MSFGSGDLAAAVPLMLAIRIQNAQERLAVSVAGINPPNRQLYAVVDDDRSGTMEISLGLLGTYAVRSVSVLLCR